MVSAIPGGLKGLNLEHRRNLFSSIATEIVSKVFDTVKRCQMQKISCILEICYRFAVKQKMIRVACFMCFFMDRYVMGESDTADCPPGGTPVESPDACPGDEQVEQIDEIIG